MTDNVIYLQERRPNQDDPKDQEIEILKQIIIEQAQALERVTEFFRRINKRLEEEKEGKK